MKVRGDDGFALVTVLSVVLIVSAVAFTLASFMRVEARGVAGDRLGLEAEQLCRAGQEMASYLAGRGLGTPAENLEGLPVDVLQTGFHYVIHFPAGDVDLYLDAEDGKINLSTAPVELLEGFFTSWSGDSRKGAELAAVVKDWRDIDDIPEPGGAEDDAYLPLGYAPRNRALSPTDTILLHGLEAEHFRDHLVAVPGNPTKRRQGLASLLTTSEVGTSVNPVFASEIVLRGIPGLVEADVVRILEERRKAPFKDGPDFSARIGVAPDSSTMLFLHFFRRIPTVLTVARSGGVVRSERREIAKNAVVRVEVNRFPDYVSQ
jgi:type II secretory pathway component PulK